METKQKININEIPFTAISRQRINKSISAYAANGIDISIVEASGADLKVVIEQTRLVNGYILNNKELYERAKEVFKDTGFRAKIDPVVFTLNVEDITVNWIEDKMQEFGIKRKDLEKQLAIDKSSLSLIMSGNRELSKPMRATFFYYFLTYELNRDFRS